MKLDYSINSGRNKWFLGTIALSIVFISSLLTQGFKISLPTPTHEGAAVLEMFVMSMCPYGVSAENILPSLAAAFGSDLDVNIHFIANIYSSSEWNSLPSDQKQYYDGYNMCYEEGGMHYCSLHGEAEFKEDLRQVCIMSKYPTNYLNYLSCINADYSNAESNWVSCASGMDTQAITNCYTGTEGINLLINNIARSDELGVSGSPTIYINDAPYEGSRSAALIQEAICASNSRLAGCSAQVSGSTQAVSGGC